MAKNRPSGLKYNIVAKNKGWVKKGEHLSPDTQFKQGDGVFRGKTKDGLHAWVENNFGKPTECEKCGSHKNLEWSNKSGEYKTERSDWQRLCKKCHCQYDFQKFGARKEFYA